MKHLLYIATLLSLFIQAKTQNVGISVNNPTRAKLEVWGVAGTGYTSGFFGSEHGISLHRNYPGIGMNQYFDNSTYGRYMDNGFAAVWKFIHDDAGLANGLSLTLHPSGSYNTALPAGIRAWHFTRNNRFQILSTGVGGSAELDVGRGTGYEGTAIFVGTNYHTYFNYGPTENTHIRGGKPGSHVILNDVANGKVIFGDGSATLGLNTNGYVPPITLEVRQSNGGMELTNTFRTDLPWEWRVANGGPANFYLYYGNSVRTYFSYIDGSLHPVSDARLKTNISTLPSLLDKLMQLKPVTYKMKDAVQGQGRSMGFLAQNVQLLFPQLVSSGMNNSADLLGLDYSGFHVIAVKGIQEEQVQINELDKDLAEINKRLYLIEQKIATPKK
ncbi:MAG: tail fiber domain-containing protein [Bacteroidota bacterium]